MTSSFIRPRGLLLAGLLMVATLHAGEGGFASTLTTEQKDGAGLATLKPDELRALDQLVADDLAYARRENLTLLDGTFIARHDEAERKQAGLDRLTPEQLARLNQLVAAAIAARPAPKERPRLKESEVLGKNKPQVHGSVTVAYGWGPGGRSMRAGSLWLDYYDPESRLSLGVGLSTFDGDGAYGYYPTGGYYYPGYYSGYSGAQFSVTPRVYPGMAYDGDFRGAFFPGEGGGFRPGPMGGFGGHGGGRCH